MTSAPSTLAAHARPGQSRAAAFVELTKPRIMLLLLVTCVATMACAGRAVPPLSLLMVTALGLALTSAGASALNHLLDRDIDARMHRTNRRPVVTGVIGAREAALFGASMMVAGGVVLWVGTNPLTASLALAGGGYYVVGYTMMLKRTTVHNIVIGGMAGAVPPLVGWAAVTGEIGVLALVLFGIICLWTPPHFWSLALLIRDDYARAGVPMLPVVSGDLVTAQWVWRYTVILSGFTAAAVVSGELGMIWLTLVIPIDVWLVAHAHALVRTVSHSANPALAIAPGTAAHRGARQVFLASLMWLPLVFVAGLLDRLA